jgi:hypothetical protein
LSGGRLQEERRTRLFSEKEKKEEFPGTMQFMRPGNSFPQICVVSVGEFDSGDLRGTRVRKDHGFR